MPLNLTWLIPGLPIITSISILLLLVSFSKTMNRLTKPVSYILIISLILSEIINVFLFEERISGITTLFGDLTVLSNNIELYVDTQALISSICFGSSFLLIMLISFIRLKRRNGYVRYFISLGLLSGLFYLFSFSGSFFHHFYDPLISTFDKTSVSII